MDFQSTVDDIDEITKQITVSVPQELVLREYESTLTKAAKTAQIKGFRPGKVPRGIVQSMLGDRVKFEVAQRLIQDSLRSAYENYKLDVVGEPSVELNVVELTQALEFKAKVTLFPTPTITNYKDRSVEAVKHEAGEKELEGAITRLLESKAQLKPIEERKIAASGDVVAMSVSIQIGDEDPGRPEPFVDVLGEGKLDPEVEAQLVGSTVGDEKIITIQASDDHAQESFRGKKVTYTANLHGLYTKDLPTLTDDFVKTIGMEVETVDAFKAKLTEQLTVQAEEDTKSEISGAVLDLLAKENPFKVPEVLVDEEIRGILMRYGFANRDADPSTIDVKQYRPQFEEFALNRIRCAIIIDRIANAEGITVEEADRDKMIKRIADRNGTTVEATKKQMTDKSRFMSFMLEVRRTKTLEFLTANSKATFKKPEIDTKASAA